MPSGTTSRLSGGQPRPGASLSIVRRTLILGNSGSGKSTLARTLVARRGGQHLDLDLFAWRPTAPPERRPVSDSVAAIREALLGQDGWVVEGCYADLMRPLVADAQELLFLDPGVETCIAHCRARPWEPHKYASKEAQDQNLEFLLSWVRGYETREGPLSRAGHEALVAEAGWRRVVDPTSLL